MATTVTGADTYINANVISTDDWSDSDAARKQRLLTVAGRTLTGLYVKYTIPDAAVYEYAAVLATVFNDNGLMKRQGVQSYSVSGVASFNFATTSVPSEDIARYIPKTATDIINADTTNVNLPKVGGRLRWTVI